MIILIIIRKGIIISGKHLLQQCLKLLRKKQKKLQTIKLTNLLLITMMPSKHMKRKELAIMELNVNPITTRGPGLIKMDRKISKYYLKLIKIYL